MTKNCLIYETLNDVKTMDLKKSNDGLMHLSGVFGVCGVRNNNQRVYEHANYAKMVANMQERIRKSPIPGELEHPQTMNITLENISHRIDSISIDENGVVSGEITLLDTPKGKIAQAIVEGGLPLFISSRAQGQVNPKNGVVTLESLSTYDLVGTPGFSQAEMHLNESLIAESLSDNMFIITEKNNENNQEDMENKELMEKLELMESRLAELEAKNEELTEQLESKQDIDLEKLANGIQKWIVEEYSQEVQNWITEEYEIELTEALTESIMSDVKGYIKESLAPSIQKWIVEEFAPEIENWVVEEYSPEIEKWCTTEFARGIEKWIVEEYAPEIENWITESYGKELENRINESIQASKTSKMDSIKEVLNVLENLDTPSKPVYSRKVNEDAPKYIQEMPEAVRVKYNMASQEVKESIARRAKLYNFLNEGAVETFWNSIDFENIKPSQNLYEGLNNIADEKERNIRRQLRSRRNF